MCAGRLRKCSGVSMYMFETPGVVPEGSLQPEGKWHAYNSTPYSRQVPSRVPQKEVTQKNWKIVAPPVGAGGSACSSCSRVFTELELPLFFIAAAD